MCDSGTPIVVFRADASPSIGGGHVMRCLAFADVLRNGGAECFFACVSLTVLSTPKLISSGFRHIELPDPVGVETLFEAFPSGIDWLVVDHYGWSAAHEAKCRPWARHILVIDDLAERFHDCDLLIDQTVGRKVSAYVGLTPSGSDVLAGSQYALLRPEFAAARPGSLARRQSRQLKHVLVSMGLSDAPNATQTVLEGIIESRLPLSVDVVLGPSAPNLSSIRSFVDRHNQALTLHVGTDAMAELMTRADLCFGAPGSTSWERSTLGLPTVLTVIADNQREIAEQLVSLGAVISLGFASRLSPTAIADELRNLDRNPEILADLAEKSATLCDGRGVSRVAMRIRPEQTADGGAVWLRPATLDDLEITYQWQSQPETRRFGRNNAVPTRLEHGAWFAARLENPASILNIVVCDGEDVGSLRLDQQDLHAHEISIVVSTSFYGRGIGLAALKLARRLVPEARLNAEILSGNARSEALFTKAGYLPEGYGWRSINPLLENDRDGMRAREAGRSR